MVEGVAYSPSIAVLSNWEPGCQNFQLDYKEFTLYDGKLLNVTY